MVFNARLIRRVGGRRSRGDAILLAVPGGTVRGVAADGDPSPAGGAYRLEDDAFSVNAAGRVAFIDRGSTSAVIVCAAATGAAIVVARVDDLVGGRPLAGVGSNFVGIDSAGRVAFRGRLADDPSDRIVLAADGALRVFGDDAAGPAYSNRPTDTVFVARTRGGEAERLADGGTVTPIAGPGRSSPLGSGFIVVGAPSVNAAGAVAVELERRAVYRLADVPVPLVAEGDVTASGLFAAASVRGARTRTGIFLWSPRTGAAALAASGRRVRGDGRIGESSDLSVFAPLALARRSAAFAGPVVGMGQDEDGRRDLPPRPGRNAPPPHGRRRDGGGHSGRSAVGARGLRAGAGCRGVIPADRRGAPRRDAVAGLRDGVAASVVGSGEASARSRGSDGKHAPSRVGRCHTRPSASSRRARSPGPGRRVRGPAPERRAGLAPRADFLFQPPSWHARRSHSSAPA
ncbi:MAG TPA: hypothetical protein VFD84_19250 [Candidatus Binatia bacterium]|nr:hypothetical protein [Candidatus Binatia bacterium]